MILHDLRFYCLDDSTKYLAIGCFLLASQHENKIPFDERWIEKELSLSTKPDWKALLESEFILPIDCDASALLATCEQDASQSRVDNTEDRVETEILSFSKQTAKTKLLEASEIFKHWNLQPCLMRHRSMNGHQHSIIKALKSNSPEEISRAIERYSLVRQNLKGRFRNVYQWTLSEFLDRKNGYNLERFNAEDWEQPFLEMNQTLKEKDLGEHLFRH